MIYHLILEDAIYPCNGMLLEIAEKQKRDQTSVYTEADSTTVLFFLKYLKLTRERRKIHAMASA